MGRVVLRSMPTRKGEMPRAVKKGGTVTHHKYTSPLDSVEQIVSKLVKEDKRELGNYCIAFRRNFSAFYVVNILLEAGIPFQIRDDFRPGEDLFSRSLNDAMALMRSPSNIPLITRTVYKVSSVGRIPPVDMVNEVLGKKYQTRDLYDTDILEEYYDECMELEDCDFFYELPIKYFNVRKSAEELVVKQFEKLEGISNRLKKGKSLKEVVPEIKEMLDQGYWNNTKNFVSFPQELEDMIMKDAMRDMTYVEYKHMKNEQEERIRKYIANGMGVQLSTMHTLKGLEFREVHVLELDNTNMPMINNRGNEAEILEDIEEEMRLLYVAVTRAEEHLHMYWSASEPSAFLPMVEEYNKTTKQSSKAVGYVEGELILSEVEAKLDLDFKEYDEGAMDLVLDKEVLDTLILDEEPQDKQELQDTQDQQDSLILAEDTQDQQDSLILDEGSQDSLILDEGSQDQQDSLILDQDSLILDGGLQDSQDSLILDKDQQDTLIQDEESTTTNVRGGVEERVSMLLNKMITEKEVSVLPVYRSNEMEEKELNEIHPREDFVEIKEGEALRSILGLICKDIM